MNLNEHETPLSGENSNHPSQDERTPEANLNKTKERSSAFQERRQARIDRLRERADKKRTEGERKLNRASSIASFIPMGQPILVGHHSEKRHRRDIARMDSSMRNGIGALDYAKDLEQRAIAAENNTSIFTEDPEAKEKLEHKIAALEKHQTLMREVNKRIRGGESLMDLGISDARAAELRKPDFAGRIGFPDYALKNNNANIRRLKIRLTSISETANRPEPEDIEENGIRIVENVSLNRVQIFFPDKPAEIVRGKLKGSGFKWSPYNGCWQRHRSAKATLLARQFLTPSVSTATEEESK